MKLLRETIQRLILENYEFNDTDMDKLRDIYRGESDEWIRQNADARGIGLQGEKAIDRDKTAMSQWHELMKQHPEFVKDFMQGRVQILHSLTYAGDYSKKADMYDQGSKTPFTDWIKKFGMKSKDQISCVAANAPIGYDPSLYEWQTSNAVSVYTEGYGFLMKGYPAFAASYDIMTQTLSALPNTLRDFHKNSGQVKRTDSMSDAIDPDNWQGIDELILDNWQIIGVYVNEWYLKNPKRMHVWNNAKSLGLPCYVVDGDDTGTMERYQ